MRKCSNDGVMRGAVKCLYPGDMGQFRDFGFFVEADVEIDPKEKSSDSFPLPSRGQAGRGLGLGWGYPEPSSKKQEVLHSSLARDYD